MPNSKLFLEALQSAYNEVRGGDPLKALREKAWDHFLELGLPDKKNEAFQYLPLKQLYEKSFCLKESKNKKKIPKSLVFTNGVFRPDLSDLSFLPKKVVVLPMLDAMRSYGTFLQNRWGKTLREESDPFSIVNLSLYPQGLFIYIPPKIVIEEPIQCTMISEGDDVLSLPRIQIFVASESEIKWISRTEGSGWTNAAIDIALEDSSRFYHYDIAQDVKGWRFNHFRATLKRSSKLESFTFTQNEAVCRNSFRVALNGEGASATLQGLWKLKDKQQAHTHVVMEHNAPECHSLQKFKGVLADTSQSSFEGKIFVRDVAQKTEAYQLNHNLLLGEYAMAYTKPNLQIFADDVKASHGATISQVDDEQLFYLKSRGLPEPLAKELLVEGFCREILDQMPYVV